MLRCVAHMALVVALVSAGGSAPFAHVHPSSLNHTTALPGEAQAHGHSGHHDAQGAHWHLTGRPPPERSGTSTLVADQHHPRVVPVATLAEARPGVRDTATPALAEVWLAGTAPELSGRPVPVAAESRPNPPPPPVVAARPPPP